MVWKPAITLLALAVVVVPSGMAATPPPGFEDHVLVEGGASTRTIVPVGIAYEPGRGALFVVEQGDGSEFGSARVRRRDAATGVVTTALTLGCVDGRGERGLLGIAFDPDYLVGGSANRYVYLYYTRAVGASGACAVSGLPAGPYNQVVRNHESGGALTAEEVLLRGPSLGAQNHNGGTIRFAPDKTLFIAMGDNASAGEPIPGPRDMSRLLGKILRINRDGTIPADNPFVGQAGARPEIWAFGFRNPFRMQFDAATGKLLIADVGEGSWEEIDAGIAGADYGWPCYEANAPFLTCNPAPTQDVKPIYAYDRTQGNCVIGGPVYRATAFPAEYEGAYFFGDCGASWIRRGRFAGDGTLTDVETFLTDATAVTDIAVSPAGCLTWVRSLIDVHETCRVGGPNAQPRAMATATPTSGPSPLTVQFDGTESSDPDQDPLSYSWAFGDATTSTAAAPQKTYGATGVRFATLTVNDGRGAANSSDAVPPIRIVVGNRQPVGTITGPAAGSHYNAGDIIAFDGTAADPEDGVLPASAYAWTVVFHHGNHTHPFLGPIAGVTSGSFTIPTNGEDSTDVHFQVLLKVTDSGAPLGTIGAVSQESQVEIVPNLTTITAAANPAWVGLQLSIDQAPGTAPRSKSSVVNFPRTLTAPSPQIIGGGTWEFVSWSDGGTAEHTVAAPSTDSTYTANYQCVAGCPTTPFLSGTRVSSETARLGWTSLSCASAYDVVRGSLGSLRATGGNFTPATQACVGNDLPGTTVDDPSPTAFGGSFYLVRTVGCPSAGSYDDLTTVSVAGPRDAEIAASGAACP
jgi:glucose/arabinose dehydrogenase/PKD repeat protein